MAGTIRGRIDTYHNALNRYKNTQSFFTSLYKFLKNLEVAGVTTEIARHGGLTGSAANVNYHDEASPFLHNAWYVFRWNTNGGRSWPWYLYVQFFRNDVGSDTNAAPATPSMFINVTNYGSWGVVMCQSAMGIGGDQNPFPFTGTMGTNVKNSTYAWRIPASGGTHLGIWPHSNGPDRLHGARAKGQIVPVDGSLLIDGETFTLNDGLNGNKVFEFDSNGSVSGSNIPVTFTAGMTKYEIQAAIITALNVTALAAGDFYIRGWQGSGGNVQLINKQGGSIGNNTITETVANAGFLVSGMSGGTGTLQNNRCLFGIVNDTSSCRAHFVADDDSLVILSEYTEGGGGANSYSGTFFGVYTPIPGVATIATKPWCVLQAMAIPLSDGYINNNDNDDTFLVDTGVAVVDPAYGARGVTISRLHEIQQAQPNRCFTTPQYEEYPIFFAGTEWNVLEPHAGGGISHLGVAGAVEFVREIYGVTNNDTNTAKTRAYFGAAGVGYKWAIPWDGTTTPGTTTTRDGVNF
jgi:hypothetical protein